MLEFPKRLTLFLLPCRSSRESLVSNPPVAARKLSATHTYTPLGGMMPTANANPSIIQGHPVIPLSSRSINQGTLLAAVSLVECSRLED